MIEPALMDAASRFLGRPLVGGARLGGGYESDVFLASCDNQRLVLHVSPAWRTPEELEWVHSLVAMVHEAVPEAVRPLQRKRRTIFPWGGRYAALFPHVPGSEVPRGHPELLDAAARLLARIHRTLAGLEAPPRPARKSNGLRPSRVLPELEDVELDAWWEEWRSREPQTGLTHGDYYGANLLADDIEVLGVVDWHDMDVGPLALEVAGASFEFCRNEDHELDRDAAHRFVSAYQAGGGLLPDWELDMISELRAWWVRRDALRSLSYGSDGDMEYARKQMRAFHRLRGGAE